MFQYAALMPHNGIVGFAKMLLYYDSETAPFSIIVIENYSSIHIMNKSSAEHPTVRATAEEKCMCK